MVITTDEDGDLHERSPEKHGDSWVVASSMPGTNAFDKYGWPLQTWVLTNRDVRVWHMNLPLNWWLI